MAANAKTPAASLSSGFHHACFDHGGGFCTFNGLAIAAASMLHNRQAERVFILDCDAHYGNGTDDIIQRSGLLSHGTFHRSLGKYGVRHSAYLTKLAGILEEVRRYHPDVILYQAGADVHEKDPLGGILSTREMRQRDQMVFEAAQRLRIPLAWNLAGGYQKGGKTGIDPVLQLHLNTFEEACDAYGIRF